MFIDHLISKPKLHLMRENTKLHLQKLFALFLLLLVAPHFSNGQTYEMKLGYQRVVSPTWFGLNTQNATRDGLWISNPDILSHIPNLNPKTLRFPGGAMANWWDWKKGWFVDDPEVALLYPNQQMTVPNTLENLKVLVDATGATPMFDLNMVSSNLSYQMAMLKHADSIGIPVKYIELGNEFYLADGADSSIIYSIFPTPQSYGTVASKWIDTIHAWFPNAKVAAQGAFNRNNDPRRIAWDDSVIETLNDEDVIAFHQYYSASGTEAQDEGDGQYKTNDVPEFMYRPFKAWNIMATQDIPKVRPGREVWITEYNMQDVNIPVHGSWGHGLFVATQSLLYLESWRITQLNFFTMDGSAYGAYFYDKNGFNYGDEAIFVEPANPPLTTPWTLSAAGKAIDLISDAMNGMTYASPLSFGSLPAISITDNGVATSYPSVYGWEFSNSSSSSGIIVNLSPTEYKINTTSVYPAGGTYTRYSDDPLDYVTNDANITHKTETLPATLTLKAYSITQITSNSVPAAPPTVAVNVTGSTTFCQGDSVQLDAGAGYYKYLWSTGESLRKIWAKAGGAYTVKVWKSENGYYAADTVNVTVNPLPNAPTIVNSGKDVICDGVAVTLSAKNPSGSLNYLWSTGATGFSINVTASGSYTVMAIDNNGCKALSPSRTITVNPLPVPTITAAGPTDICDGSSVTLSGPPGYTTYFWSDNKWGKDNKVKIAGSYTVTVTDANSCKGTSAPKSVVVHAPPTPNVSITGPTAFCKETSPTFLSTIQGYVYQWKKGSKDISGATDFKYYPVDPSSYSVTLTDNYGCSKKSSSVSITVLALPVASISITGTKNICNGDTRTLSAQTKSGYSYQWQKNNVNIANANQSTYVVSLAATYTCKVTDANGCSKVSNGIVITNNCKEGGEETGGVTAMDLYPNPAADMIHISATFPAEENSSAFLEIRNLVGALLYSENKPLNGTSFATDINLEDTFTNGMYIATIRSGNHFTVKKFLVTPAHH